MLCNCIYYSIPVSNSHHLRWERVSSGRARVWVCGLAWSRRLECDGRHHPPCTCPTVPVSVCRCSQCPHWSLPDLHRPCLMPKDCTVGEWAEWTPCSKTCADPDTTTGIRTRSRDIQQLPVGGGAQCPVLEESQLCEPLGDSVPPCAVWAFTTKLIPDYTKNYPDGVIRLITSLTAISVHKATRHFHKPLIPNIYTCINISKGYSTRYHPS